MPIKTIIVYFLVVITASAGGWVYGLLAIYSTDYFAHTIISSLIAFTLYLIIKILPDATADLSLGLLLLSTTLVLGVGHTTAYQEYSNDAKKAQESYIQKYSLQEQVEAKQKFWQQALGKQKANGDFIDVIHLHLRTGTTYIDREFSHYGPLIEKSRNGFWAVLAWIIQFITLPIILAMGIISGAFNAHTKTHDEKQYETAMDYLLESKTYDLSPFSWKPSGCSIRTLDLYQLFNDLFYSYSVFLKPIAILILFILLFPEVDGKILFVLMFSFFMLHSANAILTGNHDNMRLRLGTIFEQFFIFARLFGLIFLSLFFGFIVALFVSPVTSLFIEGKEAFTTTWGFLIFLLIAVFLIRLWPMLVMHYLYDDIDSNDLEQTDNRAKYVLKNNFWFGSPGPSMILAWKLTGQVGSFFRTTLPALSLTVIVVWILLVVLDYLDGWPNILWQGFIVFLALPFIYLFLMDRALALREAFHASDTEDDEVIITYTDETIDESETKKESLIVNDKMANFLDHIPRPLIEGSDALVNYAKEQMEQKIAEETVNNPNLLFEKAIIYNRIDWLEKALEQNADIYHIQYRRPMFFSANLEILKRLIDVGIDLQQTGDNQQTILHYLSSSPNHEMIIDFLIIEQHLLVDPLDANNNTPLVLSASANLLDNMKTLVNHGADIYTGGSCQAFIEATRSGHTKALQYLLDLSHNKREYYLDNTDLLNAGLFHHETLEMLLKVGMDPDLGMNNENTLLFQAAGSGYLKSIELLLQFGADPCRKDKSGRYAKDYAFDWDGRNRQSFDLCEQRLSYAMKGKCIK